VAATFIPGPGQLGTLVSKADCVDACNEAACKKYTPGGESRIWKVEEGNRQEIWR